MYIYIYAIGYSDGEKMTGRNEMCLMVTQTQSQTQRKSQSQSMTVHNPKTNISPPIAHL